MPEFKIINTKTSNSNGSSCSSGINVMDSYSSIAKSNNCSKCKRNSDVYIPYSNRYLCKKHFFEMFEKRFKKTNREFNFIQKGDKVALGLSGGKDSMTLLYLLAELKKSFPFELFTITIDSGIDSPYWNKILKMAETATKDLGVKHYVFSYEKEFKLTIDEIMERLKLKNPCTYCGVFRRYLLNKKSRELGATKLAIGHNLDDAAQTIFLNLVRNEPLRLFRFNQHAIQSEYFVPRIKPLIRTPEEEIVEYGKLKKFNLESKSCCPYSKFAMRKQVRLKLDELEMLYPGTKIKMFNSFISLQKLMKEGVKTENFELSNCSKCQEPSSVEICMCCKRLDEVSV